MEQLIYSYDPPEGRNHNISTFYDLVKRDHIYTINSKLSKLNASMGLERDRDIKFSVSGDYHINKKDAPVECKMIESINGIYKYTEKDSIQ